MRKILFFGYGLFCVVSLALLACPKKEVRQTPARKVLPYGKNYEVWRKITKRKVISVYHGGTEKNIYANEESYKVSVGKEPLPYKEGSVFVMIHYLKGVRQPKAFVMKKMGSQYDPYNGNWRYSVVRISDWTADRDGRLPDCAKCHKPHAQRDFVPVMKRDNL
jgi:hypothetical protein